MPFLTNKEAGGEERIFKTISRNPFAVYFLISPLAVFKRWSLGTANTSIGDPPWLDCLQKGNHYRIHHLCTKDKKTRPAQQQETDVFASKAPRPPSAATTRAPGPETKPHRLRGVGWTRSRVSPPSSCNAPAFPELTRFGGILPLL